MKDILYLSPKLMESLKSKDLSPNHNNYKSDIYSLGKYNLL
jgi:hypothetical protein